VKTVTNFCAILTIPYKICHTKTVKVFELAHSWSIFIVMIMFSLCWSFLWADGSKPWPTFFDSSQNCRYNSECIRSCLQLVKFYCIGQLFMTRWSKTRDQLLIDFDNSIQQDRFIVMHIVGQFSLCWSIFHEKM
jgi:hypothetical protein